MRMFVLFAMAALAAAAPASAQTILPIVDHIHLLVPDQPKAVEWYQKNFGGAPMTEAPDRLMFGETRLIFLKNEKGQPSTGSAIDHIGFSFADLDAKMKELEAAGVAAADGILLALDLGYAAYMQVHGVKHGLDSTAPPARGPVY